jgi:hypothetical protein
VVGDGDNDGEDRDNGANIWGIVGGARRRTGGEGVEGREVRV